MAQIIGIIGGSGFYKPDNDSQKKTINTPFGDALVHLTQLGNKEVAFITRHKVGHSIPPHLVNYRANIYALHHLGVSRIITTSAVGSLNKDIAPGNFVVPDQFIDFTIGRPKTFFDGKFETTLYSGEKR
ncbi:MAG: phosphorylase family protein, partial [Candidatus Heimdallarchaeota archaeon]